MSSKFEPSELFKILDKIPRQPQNQESLESQLNKLACFADRLGLNDAANFIRYRPRDNRENHPPKSS